MSNSATTQAPTAIKKHIAPACTVHPSTRVHVGWLEIKDPGIRDVVVPVRILLIAYCAMNHVAAWQKIWIQDIQFDASIPLYFLDREARVSRAKSKQT